MGDVMTPWDELSLVKYEPLRSLTVNDVYEMFQGDRPYALTGGGNALQ